MSIAPNVLLVELVMSVGRLIDDAEKAPSREGEWTPATVLGHLSQVDHQVWLTRLHQMVDAQASGGEVPAFVWWEPDPVETETQFVGVSVEDAAAELMASRTEILKYLRTLTPEQWEAKGAHATFGDIDVAALLFEALKHDEEHRASFVEYS